MVSSGRTTLLSVPWYVWKIRYNEESGIKTRLSYTSKLSAATKSNQQGLQEWLFAKLWCTIQNLLDLIAQFWASPTWTTSAIERFRLHTRLTVLGHVPFLNQVTWVKRPVCFGLTKDNSESNSSSKALRLGQPWLSSDVHGTLTSLCPLLFLPSTIHNRWGYQYSHINILHVKLHLLPKVPNLWQDPIHY